MVVNDKIFRELIKNGHSKRNGTRVWQITNPNILFSNPLFIKGFLDLRKFPVYRKNVIEKELSLIKNNLDSIGKEIGNSNFNLIDLRCVDGERAYSILASSDKKSKVRYCPIVQSPSLIGRAIAKVKLARMGNVVAYKAQQKGFESIDQDISLLRNNNFQRNVVLLLGSTLANFEINEFLFKISKDMFKGDLLIIGNGIRTGERLVSLDTYKNKFFDKWLVNLVKGLGFKESEVEYGARFGNSRVECFYKIKVDKVVMHGGKQIDFKKGDEILVAVIYKYFEKELMKFCKMYFSKVNTFKDKDDEYALIVCKK